jgi:hypothetical protein
MIDLLTPSFTFLIFYIQSTCTVLLRCRGFHFLFGFFTQPVGFLGLVIDPSQGLYLNTGQTQTQNKGTHTHTELPRRKWDCIAVVLCCRGIEPCLGLLNRFDVEQDILCCSQSGAFPLRRRDSAARTEDETTDSSHVVSADHSPVTICCTVVMSVTSPYQCTSFWALVMLVFSDRLCLWWLLLLPRLTCPLSPHRLRTFYLKVYGKKKGKAISVTGRGGP